MSFSLTSYKPVTNILHISATFLRTISYAKHMLRSSTKQTFKKTGDIMESNSYDVPLSWLPREYQVDTPDDLPLPPTQVYFGPTPKARAKSPEPAHPSSKGRPMPKAQALALLRSLKKSIVVASIVGFGALTGLAVSHAVGNSGNSANQSSPTPAVNTPSPITPSNSGGFFNQQGGGYGFGSGNTWQPPATGTGVS